MPVKAILYYHQTLAFDFVCEKFGLTTSKRSNNGGCSSDGNGLRQDNHQVSISPAYRRHYAPSPGLVYYVNAVRFNLHKMYAAIEGWLADLNTD